MFNFLFKSGTYFFIWKKFKSQIITSLISIFLIWLIFGIYNDLIEIFELKDTNILLSLILGKWLLVISIIFVNIKVFKSVKKSSNNENFEEKEVTILPLKSQEILSKKDILTRTDLILKKYEKNEN